MAMAVSSAVFREREQEGRDAAPTVTYCALCPDWACSGTAVECRETFLAHRLELHPEIVPSSRRRTRALTSFASKNLSDKDWDEIHEERRKRALLTGVDLAD